MLIVHSDRMGMTNTNAIIEIKLTGRYIRAYDIGGGNHAIAAYDDTDRADSVFKTLIEQCRLTKGDDMILLPEM